MNMNIIQLDFGIHSNEYYVFSSAVSD